MPEIWPIDSILHHDKAPAHKALSVKQFLAQKSITEMEHPPPLSPDLDPDVLWLFSKIKSALQGRKFQGIKDIQKNVTTALKAVPEMFRTVAALLGSVYSCSRGIPAR
jgi:hypothetical protein